MDRRGFLERLSGCVGVATIAAVAPAVLAGAPKKATAWRVSGGAEMGLVEVPIADLQPVITSLRAYGDPYDRIRWKPFAEALR